MTDLSQFDHLSDAELEAIAGTQVSPDDFSGMSDEELMKIAGEEPVKPPQKPDPHDLMVKYDAKTGMPYTQQERNEGVEEFSEGIKTGAKMAPFFMGDLINATTQGAARLGGAVYMGMGGELSPEQAERLTNMQPLPSSANIWEATGLPMTEGKTGLSVLGNLIGGGAATMAAPGIGSQAAKLANRFEQATQKLPGLAGDVRGAARDIPIKNRVGAEDYQGMSNAAYKRADETGGVLNDGFTNRAFDELNASLPKEELDVLVSQDHPLVKLAGQVEAKRGKPMTLNEAQKFDEHLTSLVDKEWGRTGVSKAGKEIQDYQAKFRAMVEDAAQGDIIGGAEGFNALKEGRHYWSQYRRMQEIEKIISRGAMTDNPAISMKNGFRNLYHNTTRMRGFNDAEKALIKRAAEGDFGLDTLRIMGSRLNAMIAGYGGGGIPGAVLAHGASAAARGAATKVQVGRALKIADEIAKRQKPTPTKIEKPKQLTYQPEGTNVTVDPHGNAYPADQFTKGDVDRKYAQRQITYQPREKDIAVDWEGKAAALTPEQQEQARALRQKAQESGLSPDVIAAQEQHVINKMMEERGQSEVGRYAVENRHRPLSAQTGTVPTTEYSQSTVNAMLRNTAWDKISKQQRAVISDQVKRLWDSQKVTLEDMISAAQKSAEDLAGATGESVKETSMGAALKNALKDTKGSVKIPAAIGAGATGKSMQELLGGTNGDQSSSKIPASFRQAEGFRDKVYKDTSGHRTVGAGFNLDSGVARNVWDKAGIDKDFNAVRNGNEKITEQEAQKLLDKSYEIASGDAKSLVKNFDNLSPNRQEALTHLAYQYGKPRLKEALPGVLTSIDQGNYEAAAARLMASDYGKKYKTRAKALARMLFNDSAYSEG